MKFTDISQSTTSPLLTAENDKQENSLAALEDLHPKLDYMQAFKNVCRRTIPYTGSQFILVGADFITVIMISRLGPEKLAASNLISSLQNWFISIGASLEATYIVAGNKIGTDDPDEITQVGSILHQSWLFSCLLSLPGVITASVCGPLLVALQQSPEISLLVQSYFYGYLFALPMRFMLDANRRMILATGNPSIGLAIDILYKCFNLGLSYCLMFGELGIPANGLPGLGIANAISTVIAFIGSTAYLMLATRFKKYHFTKFNVRQNFSYLSQLAQLGTPIGAKVAIELGALLGTSLMIGTLGNDQLAAHEASFQYVFLISTPMFCLMEASATLISTSLGANNRQFARKLGNISAILGATIAALPLIPIITIPELMLSAFIDTKDPINLNIVKTARALLLINGVSQIGDSLRNIFSGGLSGFRDTLTPTLIISAIILGINMPLGYVFGFPLNLEAEGILLARGIGMSIGAAIIAGLWFRKSSAAYQPLPAADIKAIKQPTDTGAEIAPQETLLEKPTRSFIFKFFANNNSEKKQSEFQEENNHQLSTRSYSRKSVCTIL